MRSSQVMYIPVMLVVGDLREINSRRLKMTQKADVIEYLQRHGSITRIDAIYELGIIELPARIVELEREGFVIPRKNYTGLAKNGRKFTSTRYYTPTRWA